ncbi:MAG: ABC transporter ATP-binding protein/permease [Lachnospiraceae bacterium]|nr:ABC transporter ATP-binding protein/permease [Lachnospiraceae bacterium]
MLFNCTLSNKDIGEAIRLLDLEMKAIKLPKKRRISARLAMEELLLSYRDRLGEPAALSIKTDRIGRYMKLSFAISGEEFNPFKEHSTLLQALLSSVYEVPQWHYFKGDNIIRFQFEEKSDTIKSIAFSWKYIRKHRRLLYLAAGSQLISGAFAIAAPIISAQVIQSYVESSGLQVLSVATMLLVVSLLNNLFMIIGNKFYNRVYTKTLSSLEEDLVQNMLQIENSCIDDKGSGMFIQRLTTDTERIASGFNTLADMITQLISYIGILIAMYVTDARVCLAVLVVLIIQSMLEILRGRMMKADDRKFRHSEDGYSGLIAEMVRGQKDVKFLNSEEQFTNELKKRISDSNEKRLLMQFRSLNMSLLRFEVKELGIFSVICLLGYLIATKSMLPASALVLYNYYSSLGGNFVRFSTSVIDFLEDFNLSSERVSSLLNDKEFPKEQFGKMELKDMKGEIIFDHVCFNYSRFSLGLPGTYILDDISFHIHAGESVALVGKSGCGKTTIFNLIDKIYVAKEGRVLLDNINVCDLTKESIRGNITVVSQSPYIFHMSVKENLRLSRPNASDEEIQNVCRLACIDEDIQKMPDGYNTILGEGGVNLSGGQKQRLSIARAMLRDSSIILFDEATSALDNVTQAKIQTAIDNMQQNRTVILIAHRLSTVINSDRILYMQDGKILAEGKHEELLKICKPYRELAALEGTSIQEKTAI